MTLGLPRQLPSRVVPGRSRGRDRLPARAALDPERFLIRVVLRGESGCNVTRYNVGGACWDEWPTYENMTFRVTIVLVGAGDTFSGWASDP